MSPANRPDLGQLESKGHLGSNGCVCAHGLAYSLLDSWDSRDIAWRGTASPSAKK
jgi:hypothetical protein